MGYLRGYGQVFINHKDSIDKLINIINPKEDDVILEIGPGQGALTSIFHNKVYYSYLIEKDMALVAYLKLQKYKNVSIYNEDFLEWKWPQFSNKIKVIGMLPYSITHDIIHRLITQHHQISKMVLTMTKWQSKRLLHQFDQEYKLIEPFFNITDNFEIPKEHFSRDVKVQTRCLILEHK